MQWFVKFTRGVMSSFLFKPLIPGVRRFTQRKCILINIDPGIFFSCRHINKKIIIATGYMIVCRESFVPEKIVFL